MKVAPAMAEQGGGLGAGRVTIDHLIALNDEIVAMTRAGVPIEQGLLDLGSDVPGRLGRIAKALGERMSRGEGLTEALAASGVGAPRVYRAVVEAGVRSGRLSVALEGLSSYARGYSEARRSIGLALWYPLVVLALAYALFLGLATTLMPRFVGRVHGDGLAAELRRSTGSTRPAGRPGTGGQFFRSSWRSSWRPGSIRVGASGRGGTGRPGSCSGSPGWAR